MKYTIKLSNNRMLQIVCGKNDVDVKLVIRTWEDGTIKDIKPGLSTKTVYADDYDWEDLISDYGHMVGEE